MNRKIVFVLGVASVLAVPARSDVVVGPENGFAAVKAVNFAKYERTKSSLVFTGIRRDMGISCRIPPVDTARITGFAFRYRVSGGTSSPKAGGEVFYAPLGAGFTDGRKWRIPPLVRDGEWHEIALPLSAVQDIGDWRCCGLMTNFRFDPTNAEGGRLEIAWFKFLTAASGSAVTVPAKKIGGEEVWPEVVPETFTHSPKNRKRYKAESVEFRGGTAVPRSQTAGGKVRLRYDYRGPLPKETFIPVTVLLIEERNGAVKWSEELSLPLDQCVKHVRGDVWALPLSRSGMNRVSCC